MNRSARSLVALVTLAAGCHATAAPPDRVTLAPPSSSSSALPALATAPRPAASPDDPSDDEPAEMDCSDETFARRREQVTLATRSQDQDSLVKAIHDALEIRPRDVAMRTQLMQLLMNAGDIDGAGNQAEALVEIQDGNDALGWWVMSRASDHSKQPEMARAQMARSVRLDPRGPAAQALGSQSRCTASRDVLHPDSLLTIVRGWREAFREVDGLRMAREDKPEPTSDSDAKARTCIDSDLSEVTAHDVCHGHGPWNLQTGHMHFHDHRVWLVPLPGNRFAIVPFFTGGGCRGGASVSVSLHGDFLQMSSAISSVVSSVDVSACDQGDHDAMSGPCLTSTSTNETFFELRTGRPVLSLSDHEEHEKLTITAGKLHRGGLAGCDETIDLRQLASRLPALKPPPAAKKK